MEKFNKLSIEEIAVLMDLTSGRVEDMECDETSVPCVLRTLSEELTKEHVSRLEDKLEDIDGNKILKFNPAFRVALVEMQDDCRDNGKYAVVTDLGFDPMEGFNELEYQYFSARSKAAAAYSKEVERLTRRG
jgi:hypothetical protein